MARSSFYETNSISLPVHIESWVNELAKYATSRGILYYIAYDSALRYVLYYEYPEYLLKYDIELPMKGYMRCLRMWRDAGLIKPIPKIKAVEKAVNSEEFEAILLENGVSENTLDTVKNMLLKWVREGLFKGDVKKILNQLIQVASSYGGGGGGGR